MRSLLLCLQSVAPPVRRPALEQQLARLDAAVRSAYPDPADLAQAQMPDHLGIGAPHISATAAL